MKRVSNFFLLSFLLVHFATHTMQKPTRTRRPTETQSLLSDQALRSKTLSSNDMLLKACETGNALDIRRALAMGGDYSYNSPQNPWAILDAKYPIPAENTSHEYDPSILTCKVILAALADATGVMVAEIEAGAPVTAADKHFIDSVWGQYEVLRSFGVPRPDNSPETRAAILKTLQEAINKQAAIVTTIPVEEEDNE